jgi:hypothetical protein
LSGNWPPLPPLSANGARASRFQATSTGADGGKTAGEVPKPGNWGCQLSERGLARQRPGDSRTILLAMSSLRRALCELEQRSVQLEHSYFPGPRQSVHKALSHAQTESWQGENRNILQLVLAVSHDSRASVRVDVAKGHRQTLDRRSRLACVLAKCQE